MSYDTVEISNYDGKPIKLYEFALGPNYWRYNSSETDVSYGGQTYFGMPIFDSGITQSGDVQNDNYTVTMPAEEEFPQLFKGTPPPEGTYLTVRRQHRGEVEAPIDWKGTVIAVKRLDQVKSEITCKLLTASLNRTGLRLPWGRGCPHALYDSKCKVDPNDYATTIQIQSMTGNSITSTAIGSFATNYLAGGYFRWELLPGVMERRMIERQAGNVIRVMGTTEGLAVGDFITVYPGCRRITQVCEEKFNNLPNYGGFPHMPSKSPFDGDPVF